MFSHLMVSGPYYPNAYTCGRHKQRSCPRMYVGQILSNKQQRPIGTLRGERTCPRLAAATGVSSIVSKTSSG